MTLPRGMDADTSETGHPPQGRYRAAVAALAGAQKSGAGVPLYTRYVNRPLGRRVAAAASVIGWSPNQVTVASGLLSAAGLALVMLVEPTAPIAAVAVVLLAAGYALDSADGQLARLTGQGGPAGEWLDHVVDAVRNPAIHLAILVSLYRFADVNAAVLLLPAAFVLVGCGRYVGQLLAEQLRRNSEASGAVAVEPEPPAPGQLRSLIQLPSDSGVVNFVFLLLPAPQLFVPVYAALLAANAVLAAASWHRRFAELRELGAHREEAA